MKCRKLDFGFRNEIRKTGFWF